MLESQGLFKISRRRAWLSSLLRKDSQIEQHQGLLSVELKRSLQFAKSLLRVVSQKGVQSQVGLSLCERRIQIDCLLEGLTGEFQFVSLLIRDTKGVVSFNALWVAIQERLEFFLGLKVLPIYQELETCLVASFPRLHTLCAQTDASAQKNNAEA